MIYSGSGSVLRETRPGGLNRLKFRARPSFAQEGFWAFGLPLNRGSEQRTEAEREQDNNKTGPIHAYMYLYHPKPKTYHQCHKKWLHLQTKHRCHKNINSKRCHKHRENNAIAWPEQLTTCHMEENISVEAKSKKTKIENGKSLSTHGNHPKR